MAEEFGDSVCGGSGTRVLKRVLENGYLARIRRVYGAQVRPRRGREGRF